MTAEVPAARGGKKRISFADTVRWIKDRARLKASGHHAEHVSPR